MPCYHPLRAHQGPDGLVSFVERQHVQAVRDLDLPCGRCIGCRLERSRQWAVRCMHEASLHELNCFVTLTYEVNPVTLVYRDFQLFMKRLRKRFNCYDVTLGAYVPRFFMCGEYGDLHMRPHYHACLFGVDFPDRVRFSERDGIPLFTSRMLSELWSLGHATVGAVTFESAGYVARYALKKVTGDAALEHYMTVDSETGEVVDRVPEFAHMSLKPGIGAHWYDRWWSDVYPDGFVVVNGVPSKAPRFYDKRMKRRNVELYEDLQFRRELFRREHAADGTNERLAVREVVHAARGSFLRRNLGE